MAHKLTNLTLPAFAFLDSGHLNDLQGRTAILHVRSASVMEIFDEEQCPIFNDDVLTYEFEYLDEHLIIALHHSPLVDDKEDIKELILKPCAEWYAEYCEWEDNNIINDELSRLC